MYEVQYMLIVRLILVPEKRIYQCKASFYGWHYKVSV